LRVVTLAVVVVALWVAVWLARRGIEARRQRALRADTTLANDADLLRSAGVALSRQDAAIETDSQQATVRGIHILAFSSDDCRPCHTLQKPALERLLAKRPQALTVAYIDAPSSPELTRRYQVLTVPTTVVLDADGAPRAINYGFANAEKLLAQVDAALGA
jgi:thioredoxin-like negative regulator of GroEL